jgi:hypothetical protein
LAQRKEREKKQKKEKKEKIASENKRIDVRNK